MYQRPKWNCTLLYSALFFTKSLINALFFPIFDLFYVYGMNQTSRVSGKPKMPKMQISLINYMSSWDRDVDRTQTFPLIMPFGFSDVCFQICVWRGMKEKKKPPPITVVWSEKKLHLTLNIGQYCANYFISKYYFQILWWITVMLIYHFDNPVKKHKEWLRAVNPPKISCDIVI